MNAVVDNVEQADNPALITGEELYALGNRQRSELIEGTLKVMSPTGVICMVILS